MKRIKSRITAIVLVILQLFTIISPVSFAVADTTVLGTVSGDSYSLIFDIDEAAKNSLVAENYYFVVKGTADQFSPRYAVKAVQDIEYTNKNGTTSFSQYFYDENGYNNSGDAKGAPQINTLFLVKGTEASKPTWSQLEALVESQTNVTNGNVLENKYSISTTSDSVTVQLGHTAYLSIPNGLNIENLYIVFRQQTDASTLNYMTDEKAFYAMPVVQNKSVYSAMGQQFTVPNSNGARQNYNINGNTEVLLVKTNGNNPNEVNNSWMMSNQSLQTNNGLVNYFNGSYYDETNMVTITSNETNKSTTITIAPPSFTATLALYEEWTDTPNESETVNFETPVTITATKDNTTIIGTASTNGTGQAEPAAPHTAAGSETPHKPASPATPPQAARPIFCSAGPKPSRSQPQQAKREFYFSFLQALSEIVITPHCLFSFRYFSILSVSYMDRIAFMDSFFLFFIR